MKTITLFSINKIKDNNGRLTSDPVEISNILTSILLVLQIK